MPSTVDNITWPADREAIRFVIFSEPNRRGLQEIQSLYWDGGRRRMLRQTTSLDAVLASARRRSVLFDIVDLTDALEAA